MGGEKREYPVGGKGTQRERWELDWGDPGEEEEEKVVVVVTVWLRPAGR